MKLTCVQWDLAWNDPESNIELLDGYLSGISPSDLIVLPEMWATGFSMDNETHIHGARTLEYMERRSRECGQNIMGSVAFQTHSGQLNRAVCMTPDGMPGPPYDKIKLFRMAGEDQHYLPGKMTRVWSLGKFRISPFICYDLRFPELARRCVLSTQIMVYMANWPKPRIHHWRQLLMARAIENQCFVVGVNRTGSDGNGLDYTGDSLVIDPLGQIVLDCGQGEGAFQCEIDLEMVADVRKSLPFLNDFWPSSISTEYELPPKPQ